MRESIGIHATKTALIMTIFTLVGTALLVYVFSITTRPIAESEATARLALFSQILPANDYDNNLLNTTINSAPNILLGTSKPSSIYVAKQNGKFVAVVLEAIAHDGYSGDIKLLIAIRADGSVGGVRVVAHRETPGLGDYIDITHSQWIEQFKAKSLHQPSLERWRVRKDDGEFDYVTGATITPRAVVKAVRQALQFFEQNKGAFQ